MQHNLETLVCELEYQRAEEQKAKTERIDLETKIADIVAVKEEGVDTLNVGRFTISVTSKLSRKLNYVAYQDVEASLPEGLRCVDLKPSINMKKLRALELVDPGISAMFITTKPSKAAVKVEVTA
jgi:hypothetical protein